MGVAGLEGQKGTPKRGKEPVPKEQGNSTGGDTEGGDTAVDVCQVLWS